MSDAKEHRVLRRRYMEWPGRERLRTIPTCAVDQCLPKLFLDLAGQDDPGSTQSSAKEQERTAPGNNGPVTQIAKYLHGVGDSNNWLDKILGGGLGVGLIKRIVRGYTFVSRNYQPGDSVFLIGFSRGAYTARALAGLISAKGLLPPDIATADDKAACLPRRRPGMGAVAPRGPRRQHRPARPARCLAARSSRLSHGAAPGQPAPGADQGGCGMGHGRLARHPAVQQPGTIPIDLFQFADTSLSANIDYGRHAVSIDEQRADFTPTLWDNPDPNGNRIIQGMFSGGHADVGGGYALSGGESGLSNGALDWLRSELTQLPDGTRVLFGASPPNVDETASFDGPSHEQWLKPPWPVLPRGLRRFPAGLALRRSVLNRMNAGPVVPDPGALATPYCPSNLAACVVNDAGPNDPPRYIAAPGVRVI